MLLRKLHPPIFILFLLFLFGLQSCKKEQQPTPKPKYNKAYNSYYTIAEKHMSNQKFDSAFYYFDKSKSVCDVKTEFNLIIYSLLRMAYIQQIEGDYSSSETTATEVISFFQTDTDPAYKCSAYNILGINYENLYDYDNAILYYNLAYKQADNELQKMILKNNIAVVHISKGDYPKAIAILRSLSLNKEVLDNANHHARVLANLGYCYFKIGDPNAVTFLNKGLSIQKKEGNKFGMITSYNHLSEFYQNRNKKRAIEYAKLAYKEASNINSIDDRLGALALLIRTTTGNESKNFSLVHLRINDSITKLRQKAKNHFAKIKYDSKKEKEENLNLKTQKIEDALQLEQQKNKNLFLYFIVVLIIVFTGFIYYYLLAKNKREKIKTSYNTEIRIAKKLHDELANDVYQAMAFTETQDLSTTDNKEILLNNLDTIYSRTRNISRGNSTVETGFYFIPNLKEMMSGYNNNSINILINGLDSINWSTVDETKKITVYRVLQELLVNMKKHSKCSLVVITFKKYEKKIQIDYSDNGVGVVFEEINLKNGLRNVENRILAIKGTITFDTISNKGFKTNIVFPI